MSPLRILMVCTEFAPIAKTGGLADMVAGLAGELAARGHDVRILLPRYRGLEREPLAMVAVGDSHVSPVRVDGTHPAYVLRQAADGSAGPRVYLVDAPELFGTGGIYGGGNREALRFALLAHAAPVLCQTLAWGPHIIHCHDWHAALVPLLLKGSLAHEPVFRDAFTVLTIHNIGYQGIFPAALLADLGAAAVQRLWPPEPHGQPGLNFLRAGITHADALTTVSPTHAEEVRMPEFGMGLEELLRQRSHRLIGILNGVDYRQWDPRTDPLLHASYGPGNLAGKALCKARLRELTGLHDDSGVPILGMVTRLAEQKGLDLVLEALPAFLTARRAQAVVLGEGEARYADGMRRLATDFPGQFAFVPAHDEALARGIFAGSDAFLVPSIYEPCGLTQMYALRYGSVPVVRDTGGLHDTVTHFDPASGTGTGSVFRDANGTGLAWAIGEVLAWQKSPDLWRRVISNGMTRDFSWVHQAPHYEALYRRLVTTAL